MEELTRNAVHVLPEGALEEKLKRGRPLRVKLGIDVTAPHIHLGNGIPLQRMRAFQDAGHTGVLIVGDYTARIGDPSGRSAERPVLPGEVLDANAMYACGIPRASSASTITSDCAGGTTLSSSPCSSNNGREIESA